MNSCSIRTFIKTNSYIWSRKKNEKTNSRTAYDWDLFLTTLTILSKMQKKSSETLELNERGLQSCTYDVLNIVIVSFLLRWLVEALEQKQTQRLALHQAANLLHVQPPDPVALQHTLRYVLERSGHVVFSASEGGSHNVGIQMVYFCAWISNTIGARENDMVAPKNVMLLSQATYTHILIMTIVVAQRFYDDSCCAASQTAAVVVTWS